MSNDGRKTNPMKLTRHILFNSILTCVLFAVASSLQAQQINGTPGSPNATQFIKGIQLPAPLLPFGGVIKEASRIPHLTGRRASCRQRARPTSC